MQPRDESSSDSVEALLARAESAVFGTLHEMRAGFRARGTTGSRERSATVWLLLAVEALQLLSFPLLERTDFRWSDGAVEWLRAATRVARFDLLFEPCSTSLGFAAFFASAIGLVFLPPTLILAKTYAAREVEREGAVAGTASPSFFGRMRDATLRYVAQANSGVPFLPLFCGLLAPATCGHSDDGPVPTENQALVAIGSLSATLLLLQSTLSQLAFCDYCGMRRSITAVSHPQYVWLVLLVKAALGLFFVTVTAPALLATASAIGLFVLTVAYLRGLPHTNMTLNSARAAIFGVLAWVSLCAGASLSLGNAAAIASALGTSPFIAITIVFLCRARRAQLQMLAVAAAASSGSIESASDMDTVVSVAMAEARAAKRHDEGSGENNKSLKIGDARTETAGDNQLDALLGAASAQFAFNSRFPLLRAELAFYDRGSASLASLYASEALARQADFATRFAVHCVDQDLRQSFAMSAGSAYVMRYIEASRALDRVKSEMSLARQAQLQFWSELEQNEPSAAKLESEGEEISRAALACHAQFDLIFAQGREVPRRAHALYAQFASEVVFDKLAAERHLSHFEETDDRRTTARSHADDTSLVSICKQLFDDSFGIISISGEQKDIGIIRGVNEVACNLAGRSSSELVGANINLIIPQPFAEVHDAILRTATNRASLSYLRRNLFLLHRRGHIVPASVQVVDVCSGVGERQFLGLVRELPRGEFEHMAIVDTATGKLLRTTHGMRETLGSSDEKALATVHTLFPHIASGALDSAIRRKAEGDGDVDAGAEKMGATLRLKPRKAKAASGRTHVAHQQPDGLTDTDRSCLELLSERGLEVRRSDFASTLGSQLELNHGSARAEPSFHAWLTVASFYGGQRHFGVLRVVFSEGGFAVPEAPAAKDMTKQFERQANGYHTLNAVTEEEEESKVELQVEEKDALGNENRASPDKVLLAKKAEMQAILPASGDPSSGNDDGRPAEVAEARDEEIEDAKSALSSRVSSAISSQQHIVDLLNRARKTSRGALDPTMRRVRFVFVGLLVVLATISAVSYGIVSERAFSFSSMFDDLLHVTQRKADAFHILHNARTLGLVQAGALSSSCEAEARAELVSTAERLKSDTSEVLLQPGHVLSAEYSAVFKDSRFSFTELIGRTEINRSMSLLEAVSIYVSSATMLAMTNISAVDEWDSHSFFVFRNGQGNLLRGLNESAVLYSQQFDTLAHSLYTTLLAVLCITLGLLVVAWIAVIRPTVVAVESQRRRVFELFIAVPLRVTSGMREKLVQQMQSTGEPVQTDRSAGAGGDAVTDEAKSPDGKKKKSSLSKKTASRPHYRRLDTAGFANWKVQVSVLLLFSAAVTMFLFQFFYGTSVMSKIASQSITTIYREERRVVQRVLVFHTREAVLAGTVHDHHSGSLPEALVAAVHAEGDWLQFINAIIVYGHTAYGLHESMGSNPRVSRIRYGDACEFAPSPSACRGFHRGLVTQGLVASLAELAVLCRRVATQAQIARAGGTNVTLSAARALLEGPDYLVAEELQDEYLDPIVLAGNEILHDDVEISVRKFEQFLSLCFALFIAALAALYVFMLYPVVRWLDHLLKKTRGVITQLPFDLVADNQQVRTHLREVLNSGSR